MAWTKLVSGGCDKRSDFGYILKEEPSSLQNLTKWHANI